MRFIGNKVNIVDKIYGILEKNNINGNSIFDFFSGTTSVSKYFKIKNYQVISSDLMYFSFVLQKAYIENNERLTFTTIIEKFDLKSSSLFIYPLVIVLDFLNKLPGIDGFIYKNYTLGGTKNLDKPRMFFSDENGKIIDAIRTKIEEWNRNNLISRSEYFVLLACLIESVSFYANTSGVYSAFHKNWDPRAIKKFKIRPIETLINNKANKCFNTNSTNLLEEVETDIFYLDPPYNQRQYAPNYHLLETIALYDQPNIKGVAGLRDYQHQKSSFCNSISGLKDLDYICKYGKYKFLAMSYNSEGIMPRNEIIKIMEKYGEVKLEEFNYLRYKSNNNGESQNKKFIQEQLYILKKL